MGHALFAMQPHTGPTTSKPVTRDRNLGKSPKARLLKDRINQRGGLARIRTGDQMIKSHLLYRLSYEPDHQGL
jgi:hypothetical protein